MTIWQPDLTHFPGPRYLAIADALALDVKSGGLQPGDRLPTHRELAYRLGVTVGTVSRAYAEAERRGLIAGEVGRGTYVRTPEPELPHSSPTDPVPGLPDAVGMDQNHPIMGRERDMLGATLAEMSRDPQTSSLLLYQNHAGMVAHRAAAAAWLSKSGFSAHPDRVLLTDGAQHGLAVAISAIVSPGDCIATEGMTYPGIKAACQLRLARLEAVAIDDEGLIPEAFAEACRHHRVRALVTTPNLNNPLTGVLSLRRREAIVEIARRHDVLIIEDDVYGFLVDRPAPFAELAPERTIHISSLSKCAAPGLRFGFIHAPDNLLERLGQIIRSTVWMATPLSLEVGRRWIESGEMDKLAAEKRTAAIRRQTIAGQFLGNVMQSHPAAYHFWLPLPDDWPEREFVTEARRRSVLVTPGSVFTVGRGSARNGVRVCIASPPNEETLVRGLKVLHQLLNAEPDPIVSVI
ncbi:MAG: PLP-dependent aminotransferase family protein [Parvibaculaceae bacterium]|nr:PLP-dependent aminotransferase family protein [Parvibaculaceae bacterium]